MEPGAPGFLHALRSLADGVLASAQHRLELFRVELQEEKQRLLQSIIWTGAAIVAGLLALTFGSLVLVALFWEQARVAVLAGLALFYTATLLVIVLVMRRRNARRAPPFEATLEELAKDRDSIRGDP